MIQKNVCTLLKCLDKQLVDVLLRWGRAGTQEQHFGGGGGRRVGGYVVVKRVKKGYLATLPLPQKKQQTKKKTPTMIRWLKVQQHFWDNFGKSSPQNSDAGQHLVAVNFLFWEILTTRGSVALVSAGNIVPDRLDYNLLLFFSCSGEKWRCYTALCVCFQVCRHSFWGRLVCKELLFHHQAASVHSVTSEQWSSVSLALCSVCVCVCVL